MTITRMDFSPDEAFFAAGGSDGRFIIYDLRTAEVVVSKQYPQALGVLQWHAEMFTAARRPSYRLATAHSSQVICHTFAYDISAMSYSLVSTPCVLPSSGLVRDYLCATLWSTDSTTLVLCGTSGGELVVFDALSQVFKTTIPLAHACAHGIHTLAVCRHSAMLYVGSGDGLVTKCYPGVVTPYQLTPTAWSIVAQVQVTGVVTSLSTSHDGLELLVGTDSGQQLRLLSSDLTVSLVASSHVAAVVAVAFDHTSTAIEGASDTFATISCDGRALLWDLSDYAVRVSVAHRGKASHTPVGGTSLCFAPQRSRSYNSHGDERMMKTIAEEEASSRVSTSTGPLLLTGWKDGSIQAFDSTNGTSCWTIALAHRKGVSAMDASLDVIVSGSFDGGVTVWSASTRDCLLTFQDHQTRATVTALRMDVVSSHLFHSCGTDHVVFTYDLKSERRVAGHQLTSGAFHSLSQRHDRELELLTGTSDGRVLSWDIDVVEPVQTLEDPSRCRVTGLAVSPSGKYLVTGGSDCHVKLYDLATHQLLAVCVSHSDEVCDVKWSPDERQIISVGSDACICIWSFFGLE